MQEINLWRKKKAILEELDLQNKVAPAQSLNSATGAEQLRAGTQKPTL